jgi:hypothetical protein
MSFFDLPNAANIHARLLPAYAKYLCLESKFFGHQWPKANYQECPVLPSPVPTENAIRRECL